MADRAPSLTASVCALGVAQIVSWGTLFYTIAVLGPALREAAGVSELALHACYSAGLVVSGIAAPAVFTQVFAMFIRDETGVRIPGAAFLLASLLLVAAFVLAWRVTRQPVVTHAAQTEAS